MPGKLFLILPKDLENKFNVQCIEYRTGLSCTKGSGYKRHLRSSVDQVSQSTCHQHFNWHLTNYINIQWTFNIQHSMNSKPSADQLININQNLVDSWPWCWLSADWMSIRVIMEGQSSINRVLIKGRPSNLIKDIDQHFTADSSTY